MDPPRQDTEQNGCAHTSERVAVFALTFDGLLEMGSLLLCGFLLQQGSSFLCLHLHACTESHIQRLQFFALTCHTLCPFAWRVVMPTLQACQV